MPAAELIHKAYNNNHWVYYLKTLLFARKINLSTVSESKLLLREREIMCPAVEKTRSAATDDAGMARYLAAIDDRCKKRLTLLRHHSRGSSLAAIDGSIR